MKTYFRIMLGKGSVYAEECFNGSFIGADFGIRQDLTNKLPENWREFNKEFIPVYLKEFPQKTKVAAGLACGFLWTISKYLKKGDIVICPDGSGRYRVGEIEGNYIYRPGLILPHRRPVKWLNAYIERSQMGTALRNSSGSIGTVCDISEYRDEIEKLISGDAAHRLISTDETVEDPTAFAMEKHLEDFLVQNWEQTDLGKGFDIYEEEGEKIGQQYQTDTGPIDILAISKDKKTLLILELKKGRASDVVVGQTLRYMGYVQGEVAEKSQTVRGAIIALEGDQKIKRTLSMTQNIDLYLYRVNFKLVKT